MKESNKSRDIFYGVVAIATLIVALVGATLAYFSITVSSNEGAVNAQAATVSIEYNDGQQVTAQADKLIPSTLDVVKQAYANNEANFGTEGALASNICIDSKDQQVCSVYRFTVRSDIARNVVATLNNERNGFTYLSYAVRDVTNGTWLTLDSADNESLAMTSCNNSDEDTTNDCFVVNEGLKTYNTTPKAINSIFGYTGTDLNVTNTTMNVGSTAQVYDLVIFLKENNKNQNIDQGQEYNGTIIVEVVDGAQTGEITGCIGDDC